MVEQENSFGLINDDGGDADAVARGKEAHGRLQRQPGEAPAEKVDDQWFEAIDNCVQGSSANRSTADGRPWGDEGTFGLERVGGGYGGLIDRF